MRIDEVRRQQTTPLGGPAYPGGKPYFLQNREYLNILSRTDAEALRRVVPEPLAVAEPLVRFEVMPPACSCFNMCSRRSPTCRCARSCPGVTS